MLLKISRRTHTGLRGKVSWQPHKGPAAIGPRLRGWLRGHGGRTQTGRRVLGSKGAKAQGLRRWVGLCLRPEASRSLGVCVGVRKLFSQWMPIQVVRSALGHVFVAPAFGTSHLGSFYRHWPSSSACRTQVRPWWEWPRALTLFKPYDLLMYVGGNFARARGSSAALLVPKLGKWASLVKLPSGSLKVLAPDSLALLSRLGRLWAPWARSRGAGFARALGRRAAVRGVVKNPNDHPHGGNSRSIRWPRTPWGATAKGPRRPGSVLRLRAMSKRVTGKQKFRARLLVEAKRGWQAARRVGWAAGEG
jgi:hypothetical protein